MQNYTEKSPMSIASAVAKPPSGLAIRSLVLIITIVRVRKSYDPVAGIY